MADFPVAVITDEFSQDFEQVCKTTTELEIPELEVRTLWDKNIIAFSDDELRQLKQIADRYGKRIISIASPVYKCTLPNGGTIDEQFEHDAFQTTYTFEDQPGLLDRAIEIAKQLEAPFIRIFSFWRTVEPEENFNRNIEVLQQASKAVEGTGIKLGLENEHACHFATGAEVARAAKKLDPELVGIVWDPANACVAGECAYPEGYRELSVDQICHVHAKDCVMDSKNNKPVWGDIGSGQIGWEDQLASLVSDGYKGSISLETHWGGPGGDKFAGSTICAKSLQRLVKAA